MTRRRTLLGFGFDPGESPYHFAVVLPRAEAGVVLIEERFTWEGQREDDAPREPVVKVELPRPCWNQISEAVRVEFNGRLRKDGERAGEWRAHSAGSGRAGETLLAPYFGKEL